MGYDVLSVKGAVTGACLLRHRKFSSCDVITDTPLFKLMVCFSTSNQHHFLTVTTTNFH